MSINVPAAEYAKMKEGRVALIKAGGGRGCLALRLTRHDRILISVISELSYGQGGTTLTEL